MARYLIQIDYEVQGISGSMTVGFPDGQYPDEASAVSAATTFTANYRARKGETLTNVAALTKESV